ncbi:hypothetical protein K469DRAFT_599891 [Zopfia rhizophila CBS 207.26]|uniref:Phosphoglycerate mutase-like protein n=1 Tax=Zopfia rhizophila CBS 207.26 TaxID=1314779 RepID=A0A6A6DFJ9_9PEZI|nr:hypothetical protein K469DRAFT_599891 [Zopfia rhizophila CBS 207.26]
MTKGPSVVIIARHGARLDAADKTWHLTSPTPYDPPLTYGGWTQSKALGLRIASLLHAREQDTENGVGANGANADLAHLDFSPLDASNPDKKPHADGLQRPKRKHKIVVHTSPYLRCIQTSTAIAAGIAQFQPRSTTSKPINSTKDRNGIYSQSPLSRTSASESPAVQSVPVLVPSEDPSLEVFRSRHVGPDKILLRIDAFLGEWLSPDYFEDITPPPNSTMMVAGAKADLLRRGDYIEVPQNANNNRGHFPGGWAKANGASPSGSRPGTQSEDGPLSGLGSLSQVLPFRERSSSQGSFASHSSRASGKGMSSLSTAHKVPSNVYDPPAPSYAVSPSDPIPRGYVAHARDACIEVDYQWDSMRTPQEWGDGGEYGDEWSTMHKRFRRGLGGMMNWYRDHGSSTHHDKILGFTYREYGSTVHHRSDPGPTAEIPQEEDEELVLILVTHGAGCNALLGAISNQPVLMDVGTASLSMAVRKEGSTRKTTPSPSLTARRPSVIDIGMSEEYEMKMLASLDHLRPGVDPSKLPQPLSPAVMASPSLEYRRRFGGSAGSHSPIDSPFTLGEPHRGISSSLGSIRRSSTSGSSSRLLSSNAPNNSSSASSMTGLWSGLRAPTPSDVTPEGGHSPGHDMVLNFGDTKPKSSNGEKNTENDDVPPLPSDLGRSMSQYHGLWGPPPGSGFHEREKGPKRRWTVSERDS